MNIQIYYRDIKHGLILLKKLKSSLKLNYFRIHKITFHEKMIIISLLKKEYVYVPMRSTNSDIILKDKMLIHDFCDFKSAKCYYNE
jgi:hypothetical protein